VTVKTRLGVDENDSYEELVAFIGRVAEAGCETFVIHARKAWLKGLSPRENREVPPLRYDVAARLKADFPDLAFILNGGIETLDRAIEHLNQFDGVMLGRAAYHDPYLLADVDRRVFGVDRDPPTREAVVEAMLPYIEAAVAEGQRLHGITRHMLGLFHGQHGGRIWRRRLGEAAIRPRAGAKDVLEILSSRRSSPREAEAGLGV
jgi:tRNA-dihydrouridine synthase A